MNTALWIIQGVLAAMMLMAGLMKSTQPKEKLVKMSWTHKASMAKIRFVGISEFLIGLGLILPWLLEILPILTPIAAAGLVVIMILAAYEHYVMDEAKVIGVNVVIGALAGFVAYSRFMELQ